MYINAKTAKFGKVKVELDKNSYRLRFTVLGKRYSLGIGSADPETFKIACAKAQEINSDILLERFDPTLAKYSPKHAQALEVVEQKKELNLLEIWELYKEGNKHRVTLTTQKACWKSTNNGLTKLSKKALELDNNGLIIPELLGHYSNGYVERMITDIIAASNWALKQGLIPSNPYKDLKEQLPKRPKSDKHLQCFTPDEVEAIIEAFETDRFNNPSSAYFHSHYTSYVRFLALTGCRPEEAIALTWDDVITKGDRTVIRISKAYSRGILKGTKTNGVRMFPVNDQLKELLDTMPKHHNPLNLIFPSQNLGYIDQHNFLNRYWKKIVTKLVKEGKVSQYLTCYHLRHTFITRLIRLGYDVATVAALVGNSTEMIVSHYLASNKSVTVPRL